MKRWIWYGLAAAILLLSPMEKHDAGELIPVELLYIKEQRGGILLETDTGCYGKGRDLSEAIANMKDSAPGEVFLETADYLIVTKETAELIPQLYSLLRPSANVCLGRNTDTAAASYLSAHDPGVDLSDIRSGKRNLPVLTGKEGRYHLERNEFPLAADFSDSPDPA